MISSPTWSRNSYLGCCDSEDLFILRPVHVVQPYLITSYLGCWDGEELSILWTVCCPALPGHVTHTVHWLLRRQWAVHPLTSPRCPALPDHVTCTLVVETARSCPSSNQSMLSSPTWSHNSCLGCWDGEELSILRPDHVVQPYLITWLVPWLLRRQGVVHPPTSPCCPVLSPLSSSRLSTWLIPWLLRQQGVVRPPTSPCCPVLSHHPGWARDWCPWGRSARGSWPCCPHRKQPFLHAQTGSAINWYFWYRTTFWFWNTN